jgi:riboflavin biosynthesis pyrimidine reductase
VRQIFPVPGSEMAIEPAVTAGPTPAAVEDLAVLYGNEPVPPGTARSRVRANMVASVDGAATLSGRTAALSGPADRMIFAVLRSLADVILVGAGTARAEHYRPVRNTEVWSRLRVGLPPTPSIAVVTASLDLSGCKRLIDDAPAHAPTFLLTTASAPDARRAALADRGAVVVVAGEHSVDPARAIAALAEFGHRNVLAEGGPHLLGQIADAGLLDELCLTISPVLAGGAPGRILASAASSDSGPTAGLRLAHVLADDGYLLCRYRRSDPRSRTDSAPRSLADSAPSGTDSASRPLTDSAPKPRTDSAPRPLTDSPL